MNCVYDSLNQEGKKQTGKAALLHNTMQQNAQSLPAAQTWWGGTKNVGEF